MYGECSSLFGGAHTISLVWNCILLLLENPATRLPGSRLSPTPAPGRTDHLPWTALCSYLYCLLLGSILLCELVSCLPSLLSSVSPIMSPCLQWAPGRRPGPESPWATGTKKLQWMNLLPCSWHLDLFKTVLFALSNYSEMINYHWRMALWVIAFFALNCNTFL